MRKHIADLSLMAGLPGEALINYIAAIDQLKAANDSLWLAASYEGYCAASLVLLYPNRWKYIHALRRRFPYSQGMATDLITRSDYENARLEVYNYISKNLSEEDLLDKSVVNNKLMMKNILSGEQFIERYTEAVGNYAKVKENSGSSAFYNLELSSIKRPRFLNTNAVSKQRERPSSCVTV